MADHLGEDDPVNQIASEIVDQFVRDNPALAEMALFDTEYAYRIDLCRKILNVTDVAMCNEGIAEDVRHKVLHAVIYGTIR